MALRIMAQFASRFRNRASTSLARYSNATSFILRWSSSPVFDSRKISPMHQAMTFSKRELLTVWDVN